MIVRGADVWDWGFHGACRGGHIDCVELMISKGAKDWIGGLREACTGNHLKLVQLMTSKGISKSNIRECLLDRYTSNTDIIAHLKSLL